MPADQRADPKLHTTDTSRGPDSNSIVEQAMDEHYDFEGASEL